jgi:hypothetical protein
MENLQVEKDLSGAIVYGDAMVKEESDKLGESSNSLSQLEFH